MIAAPKTNIRQEHVGIAIPPPTEDPAAAYLHFLSPTSHGTVDSCRSMLSAQVLGYPVPTKHTWGDGHAKIESGYHVTVWWRILHYLQDLGSERDRDLVIVSSGYDAWFQLPPDVLIQRYHRINEDANKRIRNTMGKAADLEDIRQRVIFSADKRCSPNAKEEPACYAVPESPLPKKIYRGHFKPNVSQTDIELSDLRPKFLKLAVMIGPVREMRALWRQVGKKSNEAHARGRKTDLQRIFNDIFGEQEYQRKVISARHSRLKGLSSWIRSQRQKEKGFAPDSSYLTMDFYRGKPLEFGIGVDYSGLISHTSAYIEEDFAWVRYNSTDDIKNASQQIQIKRPRITSLPLDLEAARPPYFAFNNFDLQLPNETWSEVPLMTNIRSGIVPAIIYDDGDRRNRSSRRDEWWHKMWFQPQLRRLIDVNILPSRRPVAVDAIHPDGGTVWFDREVERRGARTESGDWVPWEDVCNNNDADVFSGQS